MYRGARYLATDDGQRPNGHQEPNGRPCPLARKLRVLKMHLSLHGQWLTRPFTSSNNHSRSTFYPRNRRPCASLMTAIPRKSSSVVAIEKIPDETTKGGLSEYIAEDCYLGLALGGDL